MDEFLEVNFATPIVLLSMSVVFLLIGVPLFIHSVARRRKFTHLRDGDQTYALRSSIRTELIVAGIAGVAVVLCLATGFFGYNKAMDNLRANVQQEYSPSELDIHFWNGSWASATVVLPDGTRYEDAMISLQPGYRPVIAEDVTDDQLAENPGTAK